MRVKPALWAVNRAGVDPAFQGLWRGLRFVLPLFSNPPVEKFSSATPNGVTGVPVLVPETFGLALGLNGDTNQEVQYRWALADTRLPSSLAAFTWVVICTPTFHPGQHNGVPFGDSENEGNFNGFNTRSGISAGHYDGTTHTRVQGGFTGNDFLGRPQIYVNRWEAGGPVNLLCRLLDTGGVLADVESAAVSNNASIASTLHLAGGESSGLSRMFGANYAWVGVWDRRLSDAELEQLSADPFGLIRPAPLSLDPASLDPQVFFDITDVPADFGNAEAATITVRAQGKDVSSTIKLYAQVFQSDESTPLSDEVEAVSLTSDGTWTNYTVNLTGINTTADKAVWDAARVRFRWSST